MVPGGVEQILAAQGCLTIEESSSTKANGFRVLTSIVPGKAEHFAIKNFMPSYIESTAQNHL